MSVLPSFTFVADNTPPGQGPGQIFAPVYPPAFTPVFVNGTAPAFANGPAPVFATPAPDALTLTLTNFRHWEKCQVVLPLKGVTLIKGDSGDGKTTLFQAISWNLYGGLFHIHPQHLDDKKVKTSVSISLPISFRGNPGILSIERWRNPGRLMCGHSSNGVVYEDDAAQHIINEFFGTSMVWNSASYLTQKEYNNFLTVSNSEKMELLNSLAFHEDDPDYYLERAHQAADLAMTNYQAILQAYQMFHNYHQQQVSSYPLAQLLSEEQCTQVKQLQLQYGQQLKDYQTQQTVRGQQLLLQQSYQKELALLVDPTPPQLALPTALTAQLEQYQCTITDASEKLPRWILLCNQRDLITQQLNNCPAPKSDSTTTTASPYTDADYHSSLRQEQAYQQQLRACQMLQLTYHEDNVKNKIASIKDVLSCQPILTCYYKLQHIQQRITTLTSASTLSEPVVVVLPELVQQALTVPVPVKCDDLEEQRRNLQQKKSSLVDQLRLLETALTCPSCHTSLKLQDRCLVTLGDHPKDITQIQQGITGVDEQLTHISQLIHQKQQQYYAALNQYQADLGTQQSKNQQILQERSRLEREHQQLLNAYQQQQHELSKLKTEESAAQRDLSAFPAISAELLNRKLLSAAEQAQYQQQLTQLRQIVFLTLPIISSEQIRQAMQIQQQQLRRRQLEDEWSSIIAQVPEYIRAVNTATLQSCLTSVRQYQTSIDTYHQECQKVQGKREVLEGQLKNVVIPNDCQAEITQVQSYLQQYLVLLQHHQEAVKIEELNAQLKEKHDAITVGQQVLTAHHQLRDCILDTYCQALDEVVATINDQLQEHCMSLFDKYPMNIMLALYKLQKTNKLLKPAVNFSVAYKGGNFDGIKQLSGGEKDRISLALTLSLQRLTHCPFILFDESLSSLHAQRRDDIIEMFRAHGTAVWLIMHDAVDGMFDEVIPVAELGVKSLQE